MTSSNPVSEKDLNDVSMSNDVDIIPPASKSASTNKMSDNCVVANVAASKLKIENAPPPTFVICTPGPGRSILVPPALSPLPANRMESCAFPEKLVSIFPPGGEYNQPVKPDWKLKPNDWVLTLPFSGVTSSKVTTTALALVDSNAMSASDANGNIFIYFFPWFK